MDTSAFCKKFETVFSVQELNEPTQTRFDPLPEVPGMTSPKVQRLIHLGVCCLPHDECYFEVGTLRGKTLISAALFNEDKHIVACDNFSEFQKDADEAFFALKQNINQYCPPHQKIAFFPFDFRQVFRVGDINWPIGFYFYDGAHDYTSQFDAIVEAEARLASEALVVVDDWLEDDAKQGTMSAIKSSQRRWELVYELPSRFNGDIEMWWNGIGILRTWVV